MSKSAASHRRYTFGDFTLDIDRGALLHRDAEVRLRPQSFQVLRILVERHGNLVTKDELQSEVWGNKVVTDDSLTQCLLDIRKALDDSHRKIVRTVPRRGYIFDAAVVLLGFEPGPDPADSRRRPSARIISAGVAAVAAGLVLAWFLYVGRVTFVTAPQELSIAVLPFLDMSSSQDLQYLGEGLSEDILNLLAQTPELRVIARTSSFSFGTRTPDIDYIRRALDVAYVLEGSVRRTGSRLRITAQLIDTGDSSHIWSQAFEVSVQELPIVQQTIAGHIVKEILPGEHHAVTAPADRSVSGSESLLLARYYEQELRERPEVDEDLLTEVINLYRKATDADPDSAIAHSRLAAALLYGGNLNAAEAPVFRALTLNADLSEVQDTLGKYYWLRGLLPEAGAAWKRAVELNANNADALSSYAYWDWMQGNDASPEHFFRRALELDPLSLDRYAALGNFYGHQARIDEAEQIIHRVEQLFDDAAAYRLIARMLDLVGKVDESIAWTIRARDLEPQNPEHTGALAELFADLGDVDTALALEPEPGIGLLLKLRRYQEAIDVGELLMIEEPDDIYLRYLLAFAYNVNGQSLNAVRILKSSGLPDTAMPEARQAIDIEAFVTLIDALHGAGDVAVAHDLADWYIERKHTQSPNWWVNLYMACALATVDRHDEALQRLERVTISPRLPWDFLLRDARCFQRYEGEPRYQEVLASLESRQAALRRRVPATLGDFGVSLQLAQSPEKNLVMPSEKP